MKVGTIQAVIQAAADTASAGWIDTALEPMVLFFALVFLLNFLPPSMKAQLCRG